MSSMNDRPSTDCDAGKDDDVQILPGHQGMAGDEEEEEEDSHCCGKCQKTFHSLELYLQHKLREHKYSVRYNKSSTSRMIVPKLYDMKVKRPAGRPRKDQSTVKPKDISEAKYKRVKSYHPEEAIVDELQGYNCQECGKSFRRAAALRRHIDYDHAEKGSADEDEPEVIDLDDDDDDDEEVEFKQELAERPAKRVLRQKLVVSDAENEQENHHEQLDQCVEMVTTNIIPGSAVNRPYGCKECGRRFKEYPVLRAHMLTHSNVREFKCTYEGCPYSFKTKGSLKRHERRHTDDRPFRCELCDRTFRESGALTRHLKSRTLCTSKSNADLPRYGKLLPLEQYPRAIKAAGAESSTLAPGEIPPEKLAEQAVVLQEGDQISVQFGDGNILNANNVLSIVKEDGGDTVYVLPQESEYDRNQCKACGTVCDNLESLEKHLKDHLIHLPFRCGLCSFAVPTRDRLNAHMKTEHDTELPPSAASAQNDTTEEVAPLDEELDDAEISAAETDADAVDEEPTTFNEVIVLDDMNTEDVTVTVDGDTIVTGSEVAVETIDLEDKMVGEEEGIDSITATVTSESVVETVNMIIEESVHESNNLESQIDDETTRDAAVEVEDESAEEENTEAEQDHVNEAADVALKQLIHILKYGNEEDSEEGQPQVKAIPTVHKCVHCGRCFETTEYLAQHMKIHEETRPYTCEVCHKSFYTKEVLDRHVEMHNVDKRYECGECGKLFKRIGAVKEHFKSHSNDRPFSCQICGKSFKSANSRKVHLRTHTNLLPYTCEYCMRSFREKSSLERHVRVHTGERPFQCPHCDKKFSEHGTLARHLRAKIPCCKRLEEAREIRVHMQQATDQQTIPSELASLVQEGEGFNYIIQTEADASDSEVGMEYVMMTDEEATGIQNIEIITDGQESLDMSAFPPGTELVLVNSDGASGTVTMIHPETGQEFNVLHSNIEEPVTIVDSGNFDSDIHSIAMVPDAEDHVETVAMDFNQIEAVAMAPDDTVHQAMIAADVQVAEGEVIL